MTTEAAEPTRAPKVLRRPVVATLVVLAVYGVLALLNSTGGYLGTDTGAKVITLDRMTEDETFSPAVGYWAEEWDPAGDYHPLLDTLRNEDGEWVNVTTLPMLILARPLYELGGYRLALLLPMLGGVLAAFAVRDVVRQFADDHAGWTAYWMVALASPITIYSLDFWEHSVGAGFMIAAFTMLLRIVRGADLWAWPVLSGACLGAAATMRTESLVVTVVFVGASGLVLLLRGRPWRAISVGALTVIGFAVPWLLNARLETWVGGNSRAARATNAAGLVGSSGGSGADEVATRTKEALITWLGVPGFAYPVNVVVGAVVVASIVVAAWSSRRGHATAARVSLALAASGYLLVFLSGPGFVPGALVAAPVAGLAFGMQRWTAERLAVLAMAVIATVLIWSFQFTGGAGPQWGGRYLLGPTMLLLALGVVVAHSSTAAVRRGVFAMAAAVTIFGIVWLNERSHGVADFFEELASQPEDVIISTNGFLVREAGPAYDDRLYLSVGRSGDIDGAIDVVQRGGFDTFGVLTTTAAPDLQRGTHMTSQQIDFLGVPLWYHRFVLEPDGRET